MTKYSECCGKYMTRETKFVSKNILQTSKLKEYGKAFCSRCKLYPKEAKKLKSSINQQPINKKNDSKTNTRI